MLKNALVSTPALIGQGPVLNFNFSDSAELNFSHFDKGGSAADWVAANRTAEPLADETDDAPAVEAAPAAPVAAAAAAPTPVVTVAAAAGPDVDVPLRALDSLRLIIGSRVGEVAPGKTLKQLVGGRSALQNELIGELAAEFASDPDRKSVV